MQSGLPWHRWEYWTQGFLPKQRKDATAIAEGGGAGSGGGDGSSSSALYYMAGTLHSGAHAPHS
jgi:hypothetical protein